MKNQHLISFFGIFTGLLGGACLLRSQWEKKHLTTTHYTIESKQVPSDFDGYRLVFLSDLHNNVFGQNNEPLIQAIDNFAPHLVLFGGDTMITKKQLPMDFSTAFHLINELAKHYPVIYGNGNHEQRMRNEAENYPNWYETFRNGLDSSIIYLEDNTAKISVGQSNLYISGIDLADKYYKKKFFKCPMNSDYMNKQLGPVPEDGYRILLAHSPLYLEEYAAWGADLVLSGHFHGGTIRLPILGGVMSPQFQFFCGRDRGEVSIGNTTCIISGGLGTHSINIRLNNLPELICITLKHKKEF